MSEQYLRHAQATSKQHDIDRLIAIKEQRRLARVVHHTTPLSPGANPILTASSARFPYLGSVSGVWQALSRGHVALVGRRAAAYAAAPVLTDTTLT